jgi:hypothetical protein
MSIFSKSFRRLGVMDAKELELRSIYRSSSSAKLREISASRGATTPERAIVDQILADRLFWRRFWTSGLVAWLSLVVSIIALVFTLCRKA